MVSSLGKVVKVIHDIETHTLQAFFPRERSIAVKMAGDAVEIATVSASESLQPQSPEKLSKKEEFGEIVAGHTKDKTLAYRQNAGYLGHYSIHIGDMLQHRVADDGAKTTVCKGQGASDSLSQEIVRSMVLRFAEDATCRVDACGQRVRKGHGGKVPIATAHVENRLLKRKERLIVLGLYRPEQCPESGQR
jgi:hypothetical protein